MMGAAACGPLDANYADAARLRRCDSAHSEHRRHPAGGL